VAPDTNEGEILANRHGSGRTTTLAPLDIGWTVSGANGDSVRAVDTQAGPCRALLLSDARYGS